MRKRGGERQVPGSGCWSLFRPVVCMIVAGCGRRSLRLDGAHLGEELGGFSGLALGTQDLRKLIVGTAVMIMRQIELQNFFSVGIVLLGRVGMAQLLVSRP